MMGVSTLPLLFALFAVVPSLVITVMYNFIILLELRLLDLRSDDPPSRELMVVRQFVIASSKMFHLIMAYYLVQLLSFILQRLIVAIWPSQHIEVSISSFGTLGYLAYSYFYMRYDVTPNFAAGGLNENYRRWFWWLFLGLPPLVGLGIVLLRIDVVTFLSWLVLDILYLVIWWLVVPFHFKPLTNLAMAIRRQRAVGDGLAADPLQGG